MPSLCWRFNYRNVELHSDTKAESVGVLLRDGESRHQRWLGFIDEEAARRLPDARPVLLDIDRYSDGEYPAPWVNVPEGHFVQGCLIEAGVYAVSRGQVRVKLVTK
ncbi:MAG: hypothetical protein ACR2PS_01515 [Pseudomonadales bacterium]